MDHSFNVSKKGYDTVEVDTYIAKLLQELETNRTNQSVISSAIVHAENTAQRIIDDAYLKAEEIKKDSNYQLMLLQKKIKYIRMKLDSFQSNYNQLVHKYIISMNNEDFSSLYDALDKLSDTLESQATTEPLTPRESNSREFNSRESNSRESNHGNGNLHDNIVEMKYQKAKVDY